MSLDFARVAALLDSLSDEVRPTGALQMMDAGTAFEPNPMVPTLVTGLRGDRSALPEILRQALRDDHPVWLLSASEPAVAATISDERLVSADAILVLAVDAESAARSLAGLRHLVHRLRAPGGCPWDRKQTHQSLAKYALEEAYEVVDAIEHHGPTELAEELGDLLLQVFLHAELAEEEGTFTLNDVVHQITTKLIRRHPHVFGDVQVSGAADVEVNWDALKKAEKGDRVSVLDGVPKSLPALLLAAEVQKRMRTAGFEWANLDDAEAKLTEELRELREAATPEERASELGDVLFVLTGLASWYGASAEDALRGSTAKVETRYRHVEEQVRLRGLSVADVPLDELLALWNQAKSLDHRPA